MKTLLPSFDATFCSALVVTLLPVLVACGSLYSPVPRQSSIPEQRSAVGSCDLGADAVVHRYYSGPTDELHFVVIWGTVLGMADVGGVPMTDRGLLRRLAAAESAICRFLSEHGHTVRGERVGENYRRYYRHYRVRGDTIEVRFSCRANSGWLYGLDADDGGSCYVLFVVDEGRLTGPPLVSGGVAPRVIRTGDFGGAEYRMNDLSELPP